MSGYRDGQGRYRTVMPGRKIPGFFLTCERCGYLGAPHEPEICERNEAWDCARDARTSKEDR